MALKLQTEPTGELVIEATDAYVPTRTLFVESFGTAVLMTMEKDGEIAAQFSINPTEFAALAGIVAELELIGAFSG